MLAVGVFTLERGVVVKKGAVAGEHKAVCWRNSKMLQSSAFGV